MADKLKINTKLYVIRTFCCILTVMLLTSSGSAAPTNSVMQRSLALNERGVKAVTDNKPSEGEKFFREALALDKLNTSAAYNLAGVLITQKKDSEALQILETYSRDNPKDAEILARLADVYFSMKRPADAAKTYERALALDKNLPGITQKIATAYSLQGNWEKSESYFEKAAKIESNNAGIYANLAAIKLSLGKTDESIANAKRAIQLSPSSQAYATLGSAYEEKSDFKNSLISFERARDLGDKTPELQAKIKEIKKLAS